jgi:hypothetical protein
MKVIQSQLASGLSAVGPLSLKDNPAFLNRRGAPEERVKLEIKKSKKSKQENQRAALIEEAHITLLCCIGVVPGDPQKTPVLDPRPVSRGRSKAPLWPTSAYMNVILSFYINGLISRRPLALALRRES